MKRKEILQKAIYLIILLPVILILIKIFNKLEVIDIILLIVYPLLITYLLGEFSAIKIKAHLDKRISELTNIFFAKNVIYHGTKFSVPDGNNWWNNLILETSENFYLLGKTNQSWLNKNAEQSTLVGDSIIRIISGGGIVKIISGDDPHTINITRIFLHSYIINKVSSQSNRSKLLEKIKSNLHYRVSQRTNYSAVVADNRIIMIPNMNTADFQPESLVLEIIKSQQSELFDNYLADIERFYNQSVAINLYD